MIALSENKPDRKPGIVRIATATASMAKVGKAIERQICIFAEGGEVSYLDLAELLDIPPRRIKPVRLPDRIIDGWDSAQIGALLAACDSLAGQFRRNGVDRRLYFRSLILAYWDSALRLGDLLRIERGSIVRQSDGAGRLAIVQHKTMRRIDRTFRPETMAAIDATFPPTRALLWPPIWKRPDPVYATFRELTAKAGLTGTSKFIRRGSASSVEAIHPGAGPLHLGHSPSSGSALFAKSYAVQRIIRRDIPLPPPVG